MRSEEEIRKKLEELEKKVRCKKCGRLAEYDHDGVISCPEYMKVHYIPDEQTFREVFSHTVEGDWIDLAWYHALKWVLEEDEDD